MDIKTIKGIYESNTYIAEQDNVCILIEAGAPLKSLGNIKPAAIFLTHEHFDHVFHIAKYAEAFECPIYCHPATLEELKTGAFNNTFSAMTGFHVEAPKFTKFKTLAANQIITIGPFEIKAVFAPGHSAGSVVYLINNNLFTGDVLFRNSIGRTDFMPNGPELMQQSLRLLQNLKFETSYHGHGSPCSFTAQQRNILAFLETDK